MTRILLQRGLWIMTLWAGLASVTQTAVASDIILAFDKTLAPSTSLDGTARTKMLINNMAKGDVKQAMFLVRTKNINAKTIDRVEFYDETGQLIVNAGDSLSPYHRNKSYAWPIDVMKANAKLLPYFSYHQHVYLPVLNNTGDEKVQTQLTDFLIEHNYQRAYVSYEARDDYLDSLYQARLAENRPVDIRKLENVYVNLLMDQVRTYDARATVVLGYSPPQVILLHENDVSAYCILAFIDALHAAGFRILKPESVLSNPIANPYFSGGFSATGYMRAVTNLPDPERNNLFIASKTEQENVHHYLSAEAMEYLIPTN